MIRIGVPTPQEQLARQLARGECRDRSCRRHPADPGHLPAGAAARADVPRGAAAASPAGRRGRHLPAAVHPRRERPGLPELRRRLTDGELLRPGQGGKQSLMLALPGVGAQRRGCTGGKAGSQLSASACQARAPLRVGNASGFYGDRFAAMREMLEGGDLDVLTGDYLAELTMLILGRDRLRDLRLGYARTFLRQLEDCLGPALDRGV